MTAIKARGVRCLYAARVAQTTSPSLVPLVMPRDHGAWNLAFEPVALGLLAFPSEGGAALALAAGAAFFARGPLDSLIRTPSNQANMGRRSGLLLALLVTAAGVALVVAAPNGGIAALWPLLFSMLLACAFAALDLSGKSRTLLAEILGAVAFPPVTLTCALLAGANTTNGLTLALLHLVRAVPTVLVIRAYLRRKKNRAHSRATALGAAAAGVATTAMLVHGNRVGLFALGLSTALLARAIWILHATPRLSAMHLGLAECTLGVGYVTGIMLAFPPTHFSSLP